MIKRLNKKNFVTAFAFLMAATILMTPLTAFADFTEPGKVVGDGVRLRKTPVDGVILELMYNGESILIDPLAESEYSAWIYVKRVKTGTVGWMEWSYFEHH